MENEFYSDFFAYGNSDMHSIRVYRTISLESEWAFNMHDSIQLDLDPNILLSDDSINIPSGDWKGNYKLDYNIPLVVNQFIGLNIDSLRNVGDSLAGSQLNYDLKDSRHLLDTFLQKGILEIDENGRLQHRLPLVPSEVRVRSLIDIIYASFKKGRLTGYVNSTFDRRYVMHEVWSKLGDIDSLKNSITGYRIKEDYFLDSLSNRITSRVIALGIIGQDQTLGNEIMWFFYPELTYDCLNNETGIVGDEIIDVESIINNHHYEGHIDTMFAISSAWSNWDDPWMVHLDALVAIDLWKQFYRTQGSFPEGFQRHESEIGIPTCETEFQNEKAVGAVSVFFDDGQLKLRGRLEDGRLSGRFQHYYQNGKLLGDRNLRANHLEGHQVDYWPNGLKCAEYIFQNWQPTKLTRWHEDGSFLEEGNFDSNGKISGTWNYRLMLDPKQEERFNQNRKGLKIPGSQGQGIYEFKVQYSRSDKTIHDSLGVTRLEMNVIQ